MKDECLEARRKREKNKKNNDRGEFGHHILAIETREGMRWIFFLRVHYYAFIALWVQLTR
jgi:hypothetical protein